MQSRRRYTLEDIAAMDTQFITPTQAGEAAGMEAYAINLCGKAGLKWMGLEVYMSGKGLKRAHINRRAFLERFGPPREEASP